MKNTRSHTGRRPARTVPLALTQFKDSWSHTLDVPGVGDDDGTTVSWHYLDNGPELSQRGLTPIGTVLAVHGNPTWSYLWRGLMADSVRAAEHEAPVWRVVAVDQLEMGYSQRTGQPRALAQRVRDLSAFTAALELAGPVVTLGHDWGGVISLGWALDHPEQLAGVALLNTAVHHPQDTPIPAVLRVASAPPILRIGAVTSRAFLNTTLSLARPILAPMVADAFRAPYRRAADREGIGGFVADIPAHPEHPSAAELQRIAAGVAALQVPALLLWGPRDPVFSDRYLNDLIARLPHARVHRFEDAGHLVAEDAPYAPAILEWLSTEVTSARNGDGHDGNHRGDGGDADSGGGGEAGGGGDVDQFEPLWSHLDARSADPGPAVIDMAVSDGQEPRTVSWQLLSQRVREIAAGLHAIGVGKGDRVSLLVQPGPTLTALVYACLRIGAIVVVADAGLGVRGLSRAEVGAQPDYVIAQNRGLVAARTLGWPGVRIAADFAGPAARTALGVRYLLTDIAELGRKSTLPPEPGPNDEAAVLFTSGSTGPAKGVVYTHAQLSAVRDTLAARFNVEADTGIVTGFAPFALLGPALGTRSATPRMDVSAPRTLTAPAVAAAVAASGAQIVFMSPAAVLNVVATAQDLLDADRVALRQVSTFLSTGAPIGAPLLTSMRDVMPHATAHTPYGMTECLLVTDITLLAIQQSASSPDSGVCVGLPIGSAHVRISTLDAAGVAVGEPMMQSGVLGEVVIAAPHLKQRYDRLWLTDRQAERATERHRALGEDESLNEGPTRWHRTGDVGHLDAAGRLWIEGRLSHVITRPAGPLAPVGIEQQLERVPGVRRTALVGVGPNGVQQAVAVVEPASGGPWAVRRPGLAPTELAAAARKASPEPLAAVLVVPTMPTDIRHNSKIDRTRLARWADRVLAGQRGGRP